MAEIKILSDIAIQGSVKLKSGKETTTAKKVATIDDNGAIAYRELAEMKKDLDVPTKVSDLTNDAEYAKVSSVPTTVAQLSDAKDYAKTTAIPTTVAQLTDAGDYAKKTDKVSTFTNDANYADKAYVDQKATSVYRAKGSCNTADLAGKEGTAVEGDVWNLTDAGKYGPKGTNVVWAQGAWDALGGEMDLSGYVPTSRTINKKPLTGDVSLTYSDVGAQKAGDYATTSAVQSAQSKADSALPKSGGKLTGYLANKQESQARNITLSTGNPSGGIDGDVWLKYKA